MSSASRGSRAPGGVTTSRSKYAALPRGYPALPRGYPALPGGPEFRQIRIPGDR
jgi:hypothetical protein